MDRDVQRRTGLRLRRRREERGWAREELARRARVSLSLLAQLERGEANPSLSTLARLAEAAGMTLAELVAAEQDGGSALTHVGSTVMWQGDGRSRSELLVGASGQDETELWRYEIELGDAYDSDPHLPGSEVLLHVLEGTLELTRDQQTVTVSEGSSVRFRSEATHRYANVTSQRLTFVLVFTRPGGRGRPAGVPLASTSTS